jgi:hypothetical protein
MNNNKTIELYLHSDPGHAWLEVKRDMLPDEALAQISRYSYQKGDSIFLEEDCDLQLAAAYFNSLGYTIKLLELTPFDVDHWIRKYDPFSHRP